jgi:hypothetical protein
MCDYFSDAPGKPKGWQHHSGWDRARLRQGGVHTGCGKQDARASTMLQPVGCDRMPAGKHREATSGVKRLRREHLRPCGGCGVVSGCGGRSNRNGYSPRTASARQFHCWGMSQAGAEHAWACGRILPLAARSGKGKLVRSPRPSLRIAAWKHRRHGGALCQQCLRHPHMHCLHKQRFARCKNQVHLLRQL